MSFSVKAKRENPSLSLNDEQVHKQEEKAKRNAKKSGKPKDSRYVDGWEKYNPGKGDRRSGSTLKSVMRIVVLRVDVIKTLPLAILLIGRIRFPGTTYF